MARPYIAPPGVPEDRAAALQKAFMAVHRNPDYLSEAAKLGLYVSPVGAQDVARSLERMAQSPPELFEQVRRLLAK